MTKDPARQRDTLKDSLTKLEKARRDSAIQLTRRECKEHDFITSDTCRRCGYTKPFVYEPDA